MYHAFLSLGYYFCRKWTHIWIKHWKKECLFLLLSSVISKRLQDHTLFCHLYFYNCNWYSHLSYKQIFPVSNNCNQPVLFSANVRGSSVLFKAFRKYSPNWLCLGSLLSVKIGKEGGTLNFLGASWVGKLTYFQPLSSRHIPAVTTVGRAQLAVPSCRSLLS